MHGVQRATSTCACASTCAQAQWERLHNGGRAIGAYNDSLTSQLQLSSTTSSSEVGLRSVRTGSSGQVPPQTWSTECEGYVAGAQAQAAGVHARAVQSWSL